MRMPNFKAGPIAGSFFLFGFIILFPFFGTKAQKVKTATPKEQRGTDTPHRKTIFIRDGDLDKALAQMNAVNLDSINLATQKALSSIDFTAIGKNIEASMKAINADSLQMQIETSMKSIDMQKMQADMSKAMAESQKAMAEWQKEFQKGDWQKEMQNALKEMRESMKEIKLQMPEIKKEMEAAKKEFANTQLDVKAELAKAKADIERSKAEIAELKNALTEMKRDGLIKEGETVKLQWKNGRLFINGKEQSEAVSNKYRKLENIDFQSGDDNEDDTE